MLWRKKEILILMDASQICFHCTTTGTPSLAYSCSLVAVITTTLGYFEFNCFKALFLYYISTIILSIGKTNQ